MSPRHTARRNRRSRSNGSSGAADGPLLRRRTRRFMVFALLFLLLFLNRARARSSRSRCLTSQRRPARKKSQALLRHAFFSSLALSPFRVPAHTDLLDMKATVTSLSRVPPARLFLSAALRQGTRPRPMTTMSPTWSSLRCAPPPLSSPFRGPAPAFATPDSLEDGLFAVEVDAVNQGHGVCDSQLVLRRRGTDEKMLVLLGEEQNDAPRGVRPRRLFSTSEPPSSAALVFSLPFFLDPLSFPPLSELFHSRLSPQKRRSQGNPPENNNNKKRLQTPPPPRPSTTASTAPAARARALTTSSRRPWAPWARASSAS